MSTVVSNSAGSVNPDIPVATTIKNGSVYQEIVAGLVNQPYNEIVLSYTGTDLTGVVYKLNSVTVVTLTLGYTSGNLTSVVRS
jgi:hypothetical protein